MKIVICSESFPPNISGVAVFAKNLADYLSENQHEVTVFTSNDKFRTEVDRGANYTEVKFRSLPNPFRRGFRITVASSSEVNSFLSHIKPDVAHLQDPAPISRTVAKLCRKNKIPVVITNHFSIDFILSYLKPFRFLDFVLVPIIKRNIAGLYNRCTIITSPSQTACDKLNQWRLRTPIRVLSNGVDLRRFCPGDKESARKSLGLPSKPTVIYVGRIDKDKSLPILMEAIPLIVKQIDAHFAIAGSGDGVDEIKAIAKESRLEDNVSFLGSFPHSSAQFPKVYQAADIFVSPSKIETQSIVMLEAFASGLPIVAARAGSFPEFIKDDTNGYLFTPDSFSEMAGKIVKLLQDKSLLNRFSQASREAMQKHEMQKSLANFPLLYESLTKTISDRK